MMLKVAYKTAKGECLLKSRGTLLASIVLVAETSRSQAATACRVRKVLQYMTM